MKKFFEIIKKFRDFIYLIFLIMCCLIITGQCSKNESLNDEINRQLNNKLAMTDTLKVYKDKLGRINAEKHAYQLTQEELRDSVGLLKKKNTDYITYLNSNMNVRDTVKIESIIIKNTDPENNPFDGSIYLCKSDTFGKSSRKVTVDIPYNVNNNELSTGKATYILDQNIFVEGWLERNRKTNETYMHLRSDYPNLTFNSGMGIVASESKAYKRSMRKSCGIGISVGPNFSLSEDLTNKKLVPTVGIGITIGFNYTPKFLQW